MMKQDESTMLSGHKRKQPFETTTTADADADADNGLQAKESKQVRKDMRGGEVESSSNGQVYLRSNIGDTWESIKDKLSTSIKSADMTTTCECLARLRDNFELLHTTEYPAMLSNLLPVFGLILKTIPCIPFYPIDPQPPLQPQQQWVNNQQEQQLQQQQLLLRVKDEVDDDDEDEGTRGEDRAMFHEPQSTNIRPEAQIRRATLELCTRLPQNEVLRPHAGLLLDMAMRVLRNDYEENALLAARIIFEVHKSYRPILVDHVKPFLDFVLAAYKSLPSSIQKNFAMSWKPASSIQPLSASLAPSVDMGTTTTAAGAGVSVVPHPNTHHTHMHVKSTLSFRVLAEFPLTVMLLFQLYPKYIKTYLLQLLPLMMDALAQRPPMHATAFLTPEPTTSQQKISSLESVKLESDVDDRVQLKQIFKKRARELLSAQVKTLSFVTHLLRPYGDHLKQYEDRLATNVLNLFQMCPREALTIRKDLLLALRHIFATNFRKGFFRHVDTLLDERLLIGKHRQSEHAHIRATAYGALADLLLHVKSRLSMAQVSRVVHLYSRVLHDASMNLPLSVQTTSVKLLLSMVDPAFQNKEEKASLGRDILFRILETLVLKLGTLVDHGIENVKMAEKRMMDSGNQVGDAKEKKFTIQIKPLDEVAVRRFLYNSDLHDTSGTTQDIRELIRPLLAGMKTLLWCIDKYGTQREKNLPSKEKNAKTKINEGDSSNLQQQLTWYEELSRQSMSSSERLIAQKYFIWALEALKVFKVNEASPSRDTTDSSSDYRGVMESFALSFSLLESFSFQRIIGPHIDMMVEAMINDDDVCVIANVFLMNGLTITSDFASCLLKYLMKDADNLDIGIAESDDEALHRRATVRMKLFSLLISSLSTYPKCEQALRPYIQQLISICIRRAMGSEVKYWPGNHLSLLQQMFRAIAGGKYEDSYKEILPLLPTLLNGLYRIFISTDHSILRQVIIGLCLTIPARLSSLLPHLSLLLRIIVPALQSDDGDLINLGLRTLEFWVDNLSADFLYPILSQDEDLFADLMSTLSTHLQPAPYQYGLLTLRLLGKLGGKNRTFLQSPMNIGKDHGQSENVVSVWCSWNPNSTISAAQNKVLLRIPLKRAEAILAKVSKIPVSELLSITDSKNTFDFEALFTKANSIQQQDLHVFRKELLYKSAMEQAVAAYNITRHSALLLLQDINESDSKCWLDILSVQQLSNHDTTKACLHSSSKCDDVLFKCILRSWFYATAIPGINNDAFSLLERFMKHLIYKVSSFPTCVQRIEDDMNLSEQSSPNENLQSSLKSVEDVEKISAIQNGRVEYLQAFGRFSFSGELGIGFNLFIFNETISEVLLSRCERQRDMAVRLIQTLVNLLNETYKFPKYEEMIKSERKEREIQMKNVVNYAIENLLFNLCRACFTCTWDLRSGLYDGICNVLEMMDISWIRTFEIEVFHLAIFCLKDHPDEAGLAHKNAAIFFFRLLTLFFKNLSPTVLKVDHGALSENLLSEVVPDSPKADLLPNSDCLPSLFISEMVSDIPLVRYAVFNGLEFIYAKKGSSDLLTVGDVLSNHISTIKRHLFSKSLRNLNLQDQIAAIECFTFVLKHSPESLPVLDNHVLVFISESLKMMSVADGEMTSESISHSTIVDKDGFNPRVSRTNNMLSYSSKISHATGLCLREGFDIVFSSGFRMHVKPELPVAVQLRVSSLELFHELLHQNSEDFLDADSSSSIGNILPHIVSLLFRSLTSRQDTIVKTAYVALKEVLSLSVKGKNGETQRLHRLPKNLLQMCIKPVLINLREYTKLSVPLLHGLSRLLSLLSTWFSHTLGEKLLDHLQKWTEPEKIINLGIWTRGEEVYVAAEIINLFQLLADDSSQFVEPLIKTTLKLEAVLVRYNSYFNESPFRVPLARYLNRHGSAVASFFINEHRLKNPIYSELLQDIIKRQESSDLRYHLSSTECSNMVLNVCFETPLAIIRAEKGSSPRPLSGSTSRTTVDTLSMHGIHIDLSGKKAALQKEIKIKQEKLQAAKRDAAKVESSLRKRLDDSNSSDTPQKLRLISNAKEKLAKTNAMISRLQNEINAAEADLLRKFSPASKSISNDGDEKQPRFMTLDSLELQEQGFALIDTLMTYDNSYISQHHDVVRAFRWLWRSKGRHFRLLHEDAISPRYSGESRYLAKFLVNYSKTAPNDVDVLFDLLRIFLQPTSADFSFVQDYLRHSVCNMLTLEYQKKVMLRFFPVIASEGIEELKVLSIQLLILPMLEHNFKRMNTMLIKERHPSITICDSGNAHETETPVPLKSRTVNEDRILDEDLTAQLISGVLSSRSKQDTYGSRLTIELLKLCSLLLDYIGQNLGQHKHTLVKFAWNVLKNEDSKVKEWACITISKFVMRFDPPSKLTLRCYLSLLRAYQLETKDVVNVALDILVPSLALKLTKDEYTKAIKTTVQLLFEEANSLPQLTHLWHIILRHKNSYVDFRDMFMSPLVASLNKIGLPMNASVENRELALLLVDLAVEWDTLKTDSVTQNGDSDETLTQSSTAVRAVDATSTVRKYLSEERQHYKLQKNEISAIINFLVRLILLVAVADKSQQFVREKAMALLQMVLTRWAHFTLHIEYFDKVIAMCSQGEDCFEKLGCLEDEMQDVGNMSAISGKKSKSPLKRQDRVFTTSNLLLSSCLEIFSHLMIEARENNFLAINCFKISPIITTCFKRIKTASDNLIRQSMKFFLITLFESKVLRTIQELCKLLLEDMILSTLNDLNDGNQPNCYSVQFALSAVEGIVSVNSQFLNSFMLPLIKILQVFLLKAPSSKTQNRQTSKSSYCSYFPVEVLFQAACEEMKPAYSMKSNGCQFIQTYTADRPFGDEEDCIVTSLQLLFKSFVPYHFSTFRRKFITLLGDILDSSIDIRVLLVVCAQVGEWISADCKKNPLTKNEVLFFLTKFTNFESRGLSEIDMQPLSYLVSLIVLRCKAGHLSSSHQSSRGESSWEQFSDSSRYTHVINRLSASSLMSTNTLIRNTFCKLTISSDHDGRHKDNISSRHDELLSAALESVLSNLLHSDLEGLGNRMWTFIIVDSLLAICDDPTNSTAGTSQHLLSSFLNKECPSFFPSGTCLRPSSDPSVFLSALRTVSSCDRQFSQELLESLLKSAWSTLTDNKARLRLVKAMEKALNRTYHKQFLGSIGKSLLHPSSSNAVKSFLQAVALLNPLPMISVDLLLTLASNYNCWHEVRSMLEKQLLVLNDFPKKVTETYRLGLSSAIRRCYLDMGEQDVWLTLKTKACTSSLLKYAVSVDMYGRVQEALQRFEFLLEQSENTHLNEAFVPSDSEITLLEDRWIAIHKETCQLTSLSKFSELSGFSKLLMECAWKNRDWEKLRLLCSSPAAISALELGDIDVKMNEIFLAIYDEKLHDIENLHAQTAQLCLYKWQLLPSVFSGCNAHLTLLRYFNRLVDVRESGQVMVDASQHTNGKSYPDLKNLLNAWRNRLPNHYEPLSVWDDVFQWRSYMFSAISKKFQWTEQSTLASLHDRPWTTIRMAGAARQQDVIGVSLLSLSKLTDCAMDVNDAFSKLNEQILSYRHGSEDEKKGGLNLINTTNLSYFDSLQKSELFRLKAEFLESLGGKTKATQAYCHAVQLCPTYARAWISWGNLCWSLADLVETQGRKQINSSSAEDKDKKAANAKKVCQYLAQSMGCYLEAVRCDATEDSRINLPRCLIMLAKDGPCPGLLCTTFEKYATTLPSWIWLPWIPQLLSSLCRIEATSAKLLLQKVLASYPQSAYFSLRSFYLERRDSERSKQNTVTKTSVSTSVLCAEDLMSNLRKSQPTLWTSLESILEELIIRFRPSYEEELLATISALLQRAESQLDHQRRMSNNDEDAIRASFMKTLGRVSEKFFRVPSGHAASSKDQKGKKTLEFTLQYKESFERDFLIPDDVHKTQLSLDDIFSKLNKWKEMLEKKVSSTPPTTPLTNVSPYLSAFSNNNPDLWPGSCDPTGSISVESKTDSAENDKGSSPSSSAKAATRAAMIASAAVAAACALEGGGGIQGYGWTSVEIPGQYAPNSCSDAKPNPELHCKLIKFDTTVEVFQRNEHLVRRIGMVGSDGIVRHFLLQFAIPYWTKADERTTQLHLLLGKCLRKESISCRRHIWIRSTPVIPIAQRLRMTAEDKSYTSLQDIFSWDCQSNLHDPSDYISAFNESLKTATVQEGSDTSQLNMKMKIDAFSKVCESVSSHLLINYVQNQYVTAELFFQFQRAFTLQTAMNCLLQYAFMVNERTPSKFIMNLRNGHVLSPDFRFSYTNQGFIDDIKPVPFRLTRNIHDFIGPFLLDGVFTTTMASASTAICKSESEIEQALQLICRDDIVSWYLSKSSQREGTQRSIQELEHQLADRVKKNVALIQSRFQHCSIKILKDDETKKYDSCDYRVKELISAATSTRNLVSMPSNYAAWL